MSTTVIVIKGNSSQSLLNRIASALKSDIKQMEQELGLETQVPTKQEEVVARQKCPYTKRYHFDENQERLVKQYLRKNKTFNFASVKNFLKAAGYQKIHNRDLMICLKKNDAQKILTTENKTLWTTSKIFA